VAGEFSQLGVAYLVGRKVDERYVGDVSGAADPWRRAASSDRE